MRLTVLGGDGGYPRPGGACSGYLVQHDGHALLLDPGPGTFPRLVEVLPAAAVSAVLVSHGHPDHCADLNPLLRSRAFVDPPALPLPVHAPAGALDAVLRLDRPGVLDDAVEVHEFADEGEVRLGPFAVRAAELPHTWPNLAYRISAAGETLVHTGDGGPSPNLAELARGADVLLAEASSVDEIDDHMSGLLSTAGQRGDDAREADVGMLVLTHLLPGVDPGAARDRAARRFPGPVEVARPGLVVEVGVEVRHDGRMSTPGILDAIRLRPGPVDLERIDTDAAPGYDGAKADGKKELAGMAEELADLQERLWAEGTAGSDRRLLLVLQGMDTSGKGGVLRHTVGLIDPQGVRITAFKAPTSEELEHDFLWRIRKALPPPGYVGVFDRSHYEDVLIGRVRDLAPAAEIERRYDAINAFEQELTDAGTTVLKCMLHVGPDEQRARLQERLDRADKHWKYNPGDVDERARWSHYREAYEVAIERTNTDAAPWYVVPADKKWFRNLAVGHLLLETLRALDPQWPGADFDVEREKQRLADEDPIA